MVVVKVTETTSPPRSCVRRRVTPGDRDVSHIALYAGYCGIPFLDFVLTYLYKLISESTMDIYLKKLLCNNGSSVYIQCIVTQRCNMKTVNVNSVLFTN